jgi:hypothetical protein
MYFYYLFGRFSDGLTGSSSLVTIASEQPSALLERLREPIRAEWHSVAPAITRTCDPDHISHPEAKPNLAVSLSIENVDRGTGESYAQ